jgi:hypothetical protein
VTQNWSSASTNRAADYLRRNHRPADPTARTVPEPYRWYTTSRRRRAAGDTRSAIGVFVAARRFLVSLRLRGPGRAELNTEMELQTAKDATAGPTKPMGERDAHAADHMAEAPT